MSSPALRQPPKDNASECLRLMGMALKQIASAMNNAQALEAAAIILVSEPTPRAIARRRVPAAPSQEEAINVRSYSKRLKNGYVDLGFDSANAKFEE